MALHVTEFDQTSFESAVKNEKVLLVDFYATWCGPCKALAPILEDVAAQFKGKIAIGKVDVDQHPDAASPFGVRSIPTLIAFKGGEKVEERVGGMSEADLIQWIQALITS